MNNDIVPGFDDEKDDSIELSLKRVEELDAALIIHASGYVDMYNMMSIMNRIKKAIDAGFVRLIVDMKAVNYLSSVGDALPIEILRLVKPLGGDLVIQELQPNVYELFQLLGFSQFLNITHNLDESIAYLSAHESLTFPKVLTCPICNRRLRITKAGRLRCAECKSILVVDKSAILRRA